MLMASFLGIGLDIVSLNMRYGAYFDISQKIKKRLNH